MTNFNSASAFAIAQGEITQYLSEKVDQIAPEKPLVKITQRKAKLHDKNRTRRKDVQQWVFRRTGLNTTGEVKRYLKKLGRKGDGRLTAFWIDTNINYADAIADLVKAERTSLKSAIADSGFEVGNRVSMKEYGAKIMHWERWSPFTIMEIVSGKAKLDMVGELVSLDRLQLVS